MNLGQILPSEIASPERLRGIEKKHRLSRQKIWCIVAIPLLWLVGAAVANLIGELWAWEALVGWCLLCAFLVGVFILYQVPAKDDVVHEYAQEVLPGLFRHFGVENVLIARRHDLSVGTFLKSGLYHDQYNSMLREDCVQGEISGARFGMYETAMQVKSHVTGRGGSTSLATNYFYGWFIMIPIAHVYGVHIITMRKRLNSGESDDWHAKTLSHWENETTLQKIATGESDFDTAFRLNSDRPEELVRLLNPEMRKFLLYLAGTSANSFAISIQPGNIFLLIGHEHPDLRLAPSGNFTEEISNELAENVKWFTEMIRGLSKMRAT